MFVTHTHTHHTHVLYAASLSLRLNKRQWRLIDMPSLKSIFFMHMQISHLHFCLAVQIHVKFIYGNSNENATWNYLTGTTEWRPDWTYPHILWLSKYPAIECMEMHTRSGSEMCVWKSMEKKERKRMICGKSMLYAYPEHTYMIWAFRFRRVSVMFDVCCWNVQKIVIFLRLFQCTFSNNIREYTFNLFYI